MIIFYSQLGRPCLTNEVLAVVEICCEPFGRLRQGDVGLLGCCSADELALL
jgi:hypothetical protein